MREDRQILANLRMRRAEAFVMQYGRPLAWIMVIIFTIGAFLI